MRDLEATPALHAALQYVLRSSIPSDHKIVLIEALTQAIRLREDAAAERDRQVVTVDVWEPAETEHLASFLAGKVALSWQHADELLMRLATDLGRRPHDVRVKATELGLAAGVDYRYAKSLARPDTD